MYCLSRYEKAQLDKAYRVYVTDSLRQITENTARASGGGYIKKRFFDVITPRKIETRTGEEVVDHMKSVLGRLAVKDEPI